MGLALLVGADAWIASGVFVPLRDRSPGPEYLFVPRTIAELVAWPLAAVVVLFTGHLICARHGLGVQGWRRALARAHVAYLSPLVLLVLPLVSVALAATPLRSAAPPWLYLFFDLR